VVESPGFPPFKTALSAGSTPYSWGKQSRNYNVSIRKLVP